MNASTRKRYSRSVQSRELPLSDRNDIAGGVECSGKPNLQAQPSFEQLFLDDFLLSRFQL